MVAFPTVSTGPDRVDTIDEYLREVLEPALAGLGCVVERFDNPVAGHGPLLVGRRHEADDRPTVLVYGHADVVDGLAGQWSHDRDPWRLAQAGAGSQERWYGRGAADNKAQHLVNLSALGILLAEQGRLGFNLTVLIETSEEVGSPGLAEFAQEHRDLLAADVLIASDGPRLAVDVPTLFLGARGGVNLDLDVDLRLGSYHSGNWGGILRNPATTLAGAIDSLVDGHGRVRVEALRPPPPSESVRAALGRLDLHSEPDDPEPDPTWGETELSPAERLYAWNTLEVLAIGSGDVDRPVNAIPGRARLPAAAVRRRNRYQQRGDSGAGAPRWARLLDGPGARDHELRRQPHRPGPSLGELGRAGARREYRRRARGPAEYRWVPT